MALLREPNMIMLLLKVGVDPVGASQSQSELPP
jgi:hypothetical protein